MHIVDFALWREVRCGSIANGPAGPACHSMSGSVPESDPVAVQQRNVAKGYFRTHRFPGATPCPPTFRPTCLPPSTGSPRLVQSCGAAVKAVRLVARRLGLRYEHRSARHTSRQTQRMSTD
jgi:hypothetical protein